MDGLETVDALGFAHIGRDDWNAALADDLVPWAPETVAGRVRVFDSLALTAAFCLGQMRSLSVKPRIAGKIAMDIYRLIERDHSIMHLYVWRVAGRQIVVAETAPEVGAVELIHFKVGEIRVLALKGIRARMREQLRQTAP